MWEEDRWAPAKRRLTPPMPVVTPFIPPEWRQAQDQIASTLL